MRWLLLAALLVGCPKSAPQQPEPGPGEAPLERARALWGEEPSFTVADSPYRPVLRVPVVEAALKAPLSTPAWAEARGELLDAASTPGELLAALLPLGPAGDAPTPAANPSPAGSSTSPTPVEALTSARGKLVTAHLPTAFVEPLVRVAAALEAAAAEAHSWERGEGAPSRPARAPEEYFLDAETGLLRVRGQPIGTQLAFAEAAANLDHAAMNGSMQRLLDAVLAELDALTEAAAELPPSEGPLLHLRTSLGDLIVGSTSTDLHRSDAALLIDPGGQDTWENNAGGNFGLPGRVALAIDLAGKDLYRSPKPHCQGAGVGGLGLLVDAGTAGDEYRAPAQAQGAGFFGIGVLLDRGGDDNYEAGEFAQGAGAFGTGLLLDEDGNDRMSVKGRGQGFAGTAGLGAVVDLAGNDQRKLGAAGAKIDEPRAGGGQGASWGSRGIPWIDRPTVPGGVGLLYDRLGDDSYYARAYAQGHGRELGLGLLLERAGDDRYVAEDFGQGHGAHLGLGLLADAGGDDVYQGVNQVQGAAEDQAAGILWDRAGKDGYRVSRLGTAAGRPVGPGQGWAREHGALGLLVDEAGDDTYRGDGDAMGWALPAHRPDREPQAALLDLDGTDSYQLEGNRPGANPADGAIWLHAERGVGLDSSASRVGWPEQGLEGLGPVVAPEAATTDPLELPPGDLAGDATARWSALRALYREQVVHAMEPPEVPAGVAELARSDTSPAVRREAARVLAADGQLEGVDILVDSLVYESEQTAPEAGASLVMWLALLTGEPAEVDPDRWRKVWRGMRDGFDLPSRWLGLAAFERASRAGVLGDAEAAATSCDAAADRLGGRLIRQRCGALVGLWAFVKSHPDSADLRDPAAAIPLAEAAIRWQSSAVQHHLSLARAKLDTGDREGAREALVRAELLDPDHPVLLALRRVLPAQ